jgi:lipid II:glycine glycyltransferase (peptidoglycan interpeptide bridge formation enzyme)
MDLRPDLETLWHALDGAARRAVRKAQQTGVTVHVAQSKAELRTFYEMHLTVRKVKYRLLAQPYRFFESIWDQFVEAGEGRLLIARQHGQVIGGTLFLRWQDKLFYKFNASILDSLAARPNDLLIWEGIAWAKQIGCTYLDFGLSDWDQDGLIRYKRKFATDEKTISFLRSPSCETPSDQERQVRHLLPQLTELLTDRSVPNAVTERAGEVLYRLFV